MMENAERKVIKRDGRPVAFSLDKIRRVIQLANKSPSVSEDSRLSDEKVGKVLDYVESHLGKIARPVSDDEGKVVAYEFEVEDIQNLVEEGLMNKNCYEVARAFIAFRDEREKERFKRLGITREIKEKLDASNVQNQNANLDEFSFGGRKGEADSALLKQMALDYYISPKFAKNHVQNRIYIHDLDSYVIGEHNCALGDTWVNITIDGDMPRMIRLDELAKIVGCDEGNGVNLETQNIQILSRDGFTTLKNMWARHTRTDELVYTIKTRNGLPLKLTGEHRVPVLRNGVEELVYVKDIERGDVLISNVGLVEYEDIKSSFINLLDIEGLDTHILNSEKIGHYLKYKYDVYSFRDAVKELGCWNTKSFGNFQLRASDLKKLMERYPLSWDCISALRIKAKNSKKSYPICIPYTEDLAKLYAYIYADGGVYVNESEGLYQLTFCNTNEDIMDDFICCYRNVFGYTLNKSYPTDRSTSPCIRVTDGSRIAVMLFKNYAGARKNGAADISVPDFVMNGSDSIKAAYISACIDTDGCFSSRGIIYTTSCKRYAEQISSLLRSFDCNANITVSSEAGSSYHFKDNEGIRNFDSYNVTVGRKEECYALAQRLSTYKNSDKIAYKGISSKLETSRVVKITSEIRSCTVFDLETESHWFIANGYVVHNCLSVPMDELLASGFKTRQVFVRPAGSVNTAMQLVAVLFQLQSLQQFGGVSATHLDWTMVPYVRKSFMKHYLVAYLKSTDEFTKLDLPALMFQDYDEVIRDDGGQVISRITHNRLDDWIEENRQKYLDETGLTKEDFTFANKDRLDLNFYQAAMYDTILEIRQAAEGMFHNLNSLQSRSGNQLPFSSINYGTCTLDEGRIVTRAILETSIHGVGNGATSIFPCQIFQYWKGVNDKPGTPNYDLFKLAIRSTSKRLYPNYCNVDWSNDAGFNPKDPRTFPSTMGCLAGKEHLYVKINGDVRDMSIKDFYDYCRESFVSESRECTSIAVHHGAGVVSVTYLPDDVTGFMASPDVLECIENCKDVIREYGSFRQDFPFDDRNLDSYSFDVIEYTDDFAAAEGKYIETCGNSSFMLEDGEKPYKSVSHESVSSGRPSWPLDTAKGQELIGLEGQDIKVLDVDGNWVKVRHVFRNDGASSPYMMDIWYDCSGEEFCISATEDHPFYNGHGFIKACNLKVGDMLYRLDGKELRITRTGYVSAPVESFDIGTESGTFIGSDIKMHNCRTYSSKDINAPCEALSHLKDGRGNIAPATIILPTLAMEAKRKAEKNGHPEYIVDNFMDILDKAICDCKDELIERFNWICAQSPASARFMYENRTFFSYGDDFEKEGIRGALKHGTLAVGQIGLAEALKILIGCDHTDPKGMELAKRIESLFKTKCADYKERYKLNFGVYYTPGEGLCFTSMKKFTKKYGLIEGVNAYRDKDGQLIGREFFTNSIHVPVWTEIDPFEKIDIESQLSGYSSAGCICYVEIGDKASDNLEALEQIVDYAMDKDIPYFALNLPLSHCTVCQSDENIGFDDPCPCCGAPAEKVEHLARVTGYLSTDFRHFNKGKQAEVRARYTNVNKLAGWKK